MLFRVSERRLLHLRIVQWRKCGSPIVPALLMARAFSFVRSVDVTRASLARVRGLSESDAHIHSALSAESVIAREPS
jgi:hypothetical protein